jgi:putative restriction endonuclease
VRSISLTPPTLDRDWRLRLAAFARLEELVRLRGGLVTDGDLDNGFDFEGEHIRLWDRRRGIWRPRQLGRDGAALAIVTTPYKPGKRAPYDDQIASNEDWFVYRYEGDDPATWTNVALRRAMEERRPLVYLYGVTPGLYEPIFPCYVVDDNPQELAFHIAADAPSVQPMPTPVELDVSAGRRAYATAAVKVRLHQRRFRALVVSAYQERCAICRLGHSELLDAAHILPDRDERGRPEVPNGLSLCKIHHGAYDSNILGVDPDYLVHIRRDILDEHDGPMLLHGLQELHEKPMTLPKSGRHHPNREYLEERFARFRAA